MVSMIPILLAFLPLVFSIGMCVATKVKAFKCLFCYTSTLQITAQQQELLFLEQQFNQRKEELHVLQDCISQKKGDLKEALRDGETEANEKLRQIRVTFPNEFSIHYIVEEMQKNRSIKNIP